MNNIFINTCLIDPIKLRPVQLDRHISQTLCNELKKKFEGKCSYHGYIKPGSIEIFKYSMGELQPASFNGDTCYTVQYYADVCNPTIGSIITATVQKTNKFGFLAESGCVINKKYVPIIDIIVARQSNGWENEIDIDSFKPGDEVTIEIKGKKFELKKEKISAVGRIVKSKKNSKLILDVDDDQAKIANDEDDDVVSVNSDEVLDEDVKSEQEEDDDDNLKGGNAEDVESDEGTLDNDEESLFGEDDASLDGGIDGDDIISSGDESE